MTAKEYMFNQNEKLFHYFRSEMETDTREQMEWLNKQICDFFTVEEAFLILEFSDYEPCLDDGDELKIKDGKLVIVQETCDTCGKTLNSDDEGGEKCGEGCEEYDRGLQST